MNTMLVYSVLLLQPVCLEITRYSRGRVSGVTRQCESASTCNAKVALDGDPCPRNNRQQACSSCHEPVCEVLTTAAAIPTSQSPGKLYVMLITGNDVDTSLL